MRDDSHGLLVSRPVLAVKEHGQDVVVQKAIRPIAHLGLGLLDVAAGVRRPAGVARPFQGVKVLLPQLGQLNGLPPPVDPLRRYPRPLQVGRENVGEVDATGAEVLRQALHLGLARV